MKKTSTPLSCGIALILFFMPYHGLLAQCTNADFENGSFGNWTGTYGTDSCQGGTLFGLCLGCEISDPFQNIGLLQGPLNDPSNDATTQYCQVITSTAGGYDPVLSANGVNLPTVWPGSGSYSARMGNTWPETGDNPDAESLSYSFVVDASNCNFTYHYAVILDVGAGHLPVEQPYFKIRLYNAAGDTISCNGYDVDASSAQNIGGFDSLNDVNGAGEIYYKNWSSVFVPLSNYIGQTMTLTFITRSCMPSGCAGTHFAIAYVDAECAPMQIITSSPTICGGQNITLTAPAGAATYLWQGPGIVSGGSSQVVTVNQAGQYEVQMTTFGNSPCSFSLDTVIVASPANPTANFSSTVVCVGNPTTFTDLSTPAGSIASWAWDFTNSGTTQSTAKNPTYTFDSAGTYPVTLTVGSSPCSGDTTINVVVSPSPTSTFTATGPVCEGSASTITYTGNAPSTDTYTWNFNGGTIISGTGQGPYQVSWATGGTKNVTLTVAAGTCTSSQTTVPVTVNAFPGIAVTPDTTICTGTSVTLTATGGSGYTWSPNTGLSATTGASVIATPTTTQTYTVSGTNANCPGSASVTVTVNGIPTSTFTATGPVCTGQNSTITYTGNAPTGATYNWNFAGGTVSSGTGQGPYQVNWANPGSENITLSVTEGTCVSTLTTVPVTVNSGVNSLFTVTSPVCAGNNSTITYTGNATTGATYNWSFAGGTVASGTGQGPYQVNWANTGTDSVALSVSQNGCTSPTTTIPVLVTQIPTSAFTVVTPVCAGQNSTITYTGNAPAGAAYVWNFNGGTIASGTGQGPYKVNWPGAGNENVTLSVTEGTCASTLTTVPVTVNPTPTSAFTVVSPVCTGQNSTITYTGNGTGAATYTWAFSGGTIASGTGAGPYSVNWAAAGTDSVILVVGQNGCSSSTGTVVVVNPIPTSAFTVTSPVCEGQNSTITYTGTATSAANYTWVFNNPTTPAGTSQGPYNLRWDSAGTYAIALAVSQNGCISDTTVIPVTVNAIPVSFAGNDTSFCSGDSATIGTTPTAGYTYTWVPATGLSNANIANPIADLTNTTTNTIVTKYVVTTSQSGCSASDSIVVTVYPNPAPSYIVPAGQCLTGNSFSFVAGGSFLPNATFVWSFGANATPVTSTLSAQNVSFSSPGKQTVSITVSQDACINTFTDSVSVFPEPSAGFTPDSIIGCENFNVCFDNTTATTDSANYFWTFGDSTTSQLATPCHTYGPPGVYSVTLKVTTVNGCKSDSTEDNAIHVIADPKAMFTESATVVQIPHGNVAFLNQSENAATYLWELGTADTSTQVSPVYNFTDSGEYNIVLTAYNQLGCPDSTQQLLIVVPPDNFYIPNVFSPNGDGFNDEFYIYAQQGAVVQSFKVFDRNGEKVHDGNYPWDGNYRGRPAPEGVYVYEIELGLVYNTYTTLKKGSVTLLR